tara:strand:- start:217 stop:1038 length:822 start_codon:yes stop_codon:yes gene_type:complete
MEFRNGYTIKPKEVLGNGQVVFTDGTTDVLPNQAACEAYGYTYDTASRSCIAYMYSGQTETAINNEKNIVKGAQNSTEANTTNTFIMGESNTTKGDNRNNIIIGDYNEIANGVNNAAIFGNYGKATRDGEIVFGGGGFNGAAIGKAQSSTITLTGTTTDSTATNLFVNGDPNVTAIARGGTGTFESFEVMIIGVRTGGDGSGSVNDRKAVKTYGLIYLEAVDQTTYKIGEFGTVSGWTGQAAFSGGNMFIQVTGADNVSISWTATLDLYELKV